MTVTHCDPRWGCGAYGVRRDTAKARVYVRCTLRMIGWGHRESIGYIYIEASFIVAVLSLG